MDELDLTEEEKYALRYPPPWSPYTYDEKTHVWALTHPGTYVCVSCGLEYKFFRGSSPEQPAGLPQCPPCPTPAAEAPKASKVVRCSNRYSAGWCTLEKNHEGGCL